ncbi:MAG: hypothetical protein HC819_06510 [Cyclobacteriaceae bacterium]|nr:hypothetical protein [Cyclobacteriaceae bacterium]
MTKQLLFLLALACPFIVNAQKISASGSFDFLKEAKKMQTSFNYENVVVGEFSNENDYVRREVTEKNDKEPGSGEIWKEKWYANRSNRFEPNFLELFNKHAADYGVSAVRDEQTKYVMEVKTISIDPGWNVGVMRRPALIDFVVYFYDRNEPDNILAKVELAKCTGQDAMGYDFDSAYRMEEAYAKGAKSLAKYLAKKMPK